MPDVLSADVSWAIAAHIIPLCAVADSVKSMTDRCAEHHNKSIKYFYLLYTDAIELCIAAERDIQRRFCRNLESGSESCPNGSSIR